MGRNDLATVEEMEVKSPFYSLTLASLDIDVRCLPSNLQYAIAAYAAASYTLLRCRTVFAVTVSHVH